VASNVLTYGTIIFQMLIVPFIYILVITTIGAFAPSPTGQSISNTEAFFYSSGLVLSSHPVIAMAISDSYFVNGDPLFIYTNTTYLQGRTVLVVSPWLLFCIEALLISALLVMLSIRMVQPVRYRSKSKKQVAPAEVPQPETVVEGQQA
jgi:hypothetical protein